MSSYTSGRWLTLNRITSKPDSVAYLQALGRWGHDSTVIDSVRRLQGDFVLTLYRAMAHSRDPASYPQFIECQLQPIDAHVGVRVRVQAAVDQASKQRAFTEAGADGVAVMQSRLPHGIGIEIYRPICGRDAKSGVLRRVDGVSLTDSLAKPVSPPRP